MNLLVFCNQLRKIGYGEDVIDEVKEAFRVKAELDEFRENAEINLET